jgi:uncharacterized protein involved in exopolysaccharide biosynthesis
MTTAEIILSAGVALMGGGNVWNWLSSRGKTKVDLITLGQTISVQIIAGLKTEREELLTKIEGLETLIGELVSHVEALESALRAAGITPPPRPRKKA